MPAASFPRNEAARVALLRSLDILDAGPERTADAVVVAAASIANVPVSAISLVDADRQWFKASCGLSAKETSREVSFCAHALLDTEPLIVRDAREDDRFCDNPLVTGPPYIRFYAGFVLSAHDVRVGALCLINDLPRILTASQMSRLSDLAALTSAWIAGPTRRVQR